MQDMSRVLIPEEEENFKEGTWGFHFQLVRKVFGIDSKPGQYLIEKADSNPDGFSGKTSRTESHMIAILHELHKLDIKSSKRFTK